MAKHIEDIYPMIRKSVLNQNNEPLLYVSIEKEGISIYVSTALAKKTLLDIVLLRLHTVFSNLRNYGKEPKHDD